MKLIPNNSLPYHVHPEIQAMIRLRRLGVMEESLTAYDAPRNGQVVVCIRNKAKKHTFWTCVSPECKWQSVYVYLKAVSDE